MASLRQRSPLRLCDLGSPGHAPGSQVGLEPRRPMHSAPTMHNDYDVIMGRRSRPSDTRLGAPFTIGPTSVKSPTSAIEPVSTLGLSDSTLYDTSPMRLHRTSPTRALVLGPASTTSLRDNLSPARPGPLMGLSETPPLKVARSSVRGFHSSSPKLPAAESGPAVEEGGSSLEVWALRGSLTQSERRRGLLADSLREACGALAEQASRLQRRQAELTDSRATVEELTVRQKYLESSIAALEREREQLGVGAGAHQRELQQRVWRLEEQISDARSSLDEVATETRRRRSLERVRLDAQALARARTGGWPGTSPSRCSGGLPLSANGALTPLGCPHGCSSAGIASPPHPVSPGHLASGRLAEDAWVRRTLMTQLDELKGERQTATREKEQQSSRIRMLEEASAELQTRLGAVEGERDQLKQERDELSKRAEALVHDAETGSRQKSGLETELAEKTAELARVKGRAERVEEERARAVEELRALQTVRERQSAEVSDLRQKLETERERLLRHEAEGRLAGARAGALQCERERLLAEKELTERERRQLQSQLDSLRDAHESTRTALAESQAHCSELESRLHERAEGQTGPSLSSPPSPAPSSPSRLGRAQEPDEGGGGGAGTEGEWRARWEEATIVVETREAELQLATMQVRDLEEECRQLRRQAEEHKDAQPHLGSAGAGDAGEEAESLRRRLVENQELQQQQEQLITTLREELEEAMTKRPQAIRHSLDELDGELSVVRAEMERVWDELRSREATLEDQQLELTSARAQLASCGAERRGLEQEVATLRRELARKEEASSSRERALAAERMQLQVKLTTLEMKVSEQEMLDESRTRSVSTLSEKLESLERENREFRQRHSKARAQAEDLAARVQDLSRLNLALQEERDQAKQELQQIRCGFQDLRDSTEIQKLRVRELEGVARHLQKDDQLKTTQLTALVIELRELRKAYQSVSGAEPGAADASHADWVSRSRIIRNAIEAIEGQAGHVRVLEEELRALRAAPGFQSLEAEMQQLRKDAQASANKMTALVIELKLLKEKNKKLMRDKVHLEQRLEDAGLSHDLSPELSYDLSHGGRGKQAWGSFLSADVDERPPQQTPPCPASRDDELPSLAATSTCEQFSLIFTSPSPTSSSPRTAMGSEGSQGSQGGRGTPQPIGRPRHSSLSPVRRAEKSRGHRAWPPQSPMSHEDSAQGSHREGLMAGARNNREKEEDDDTGDDDNGDEESAGENVIYDNEEFSQLRSTPLPAGIAEPPAFRSLSPLAGPPASPPKAGWTGASQEQ